MCHYVTQFFFFFLQPKNSPNSSISAVNSEYFSKICVSRSYRIFVAEISLEKSQTEELARQLKDANSEAYQWKNKAANCEDEIMSLKDNLELSGVARGQNEEELKNRIKELENRCHGRVTNVYG